jgi:hypothetical protein
MNSLNNYFLKPLLQELPSIKIIAVSMASLSFFRLQGQLSLQATFKITSGLVLTTAIGEIYRNRTTLKKVDWFKRAEGWFKTYDIPVILIGKLAFDIFKGNNIEKPTCQGMLYHVLLAPVAEEILFRGYLQNRVEEILHLTIGKFFSENELIDIAGTVQGIVFALFHSSYPSYQKIQMFIISKKLLSLRNQYNSLMPSFMYHTYHNLNVDLLKIILSK